MADVKPACFDIQTYKNRSCAATDTAYDCYFPRLQVLNPVVIPGQEWWLVAEAARAVNAFPLGAAGSPPCGGALTFTLRPGAPIHLTREQVQRLCKQGPN